MAERLKAIHIRNEIKYVPNIMRFSHKPEQKQSTKPAKILMVANLVPWKNHLLGIEAIKILLSNGFEVDFDLFGSDPLGENKVYADSVRRVVADTGNNGHIRLIEGEMISGSTYSSYHCLMHTAIDEPFGRVIVEAMGNGLPVVGVNSGCTPHLIHTYAGGIISAGNSAIEVSDALKTIITNHQQVAQQLASNMQRIRADYSQQTALSALERAGIVLPLRNRCG